MEESSAATQWRGYSAAGLAQRTALFALVWLVLSGAEASSWWWGLPAAALAALLVPGPVWRWRPRAIIRFIAVFLWLSLYSAVDVGWRALHPRRPLNPALVTYRWRLPEGPPRLLLACLINLLPGSVSVRIEPHALSVHLLNYTPHSLRYVARLEGHVAALFGAPLTEAVDD